MTPIDWALRPLKRYADFSGRAPRAEYWWYSLAASIFGIMMDLVDQYTVGPIYGGQGPLGLIFSIALIIPNVTVAVRRLHDIDRSGWWVVLNAWAYFFLLPGSTRQSLIQSFKALPTGVGFVLVLAFVAGVITLLVFMITRGSEGPNRYGSDPYGPDALEEVFA